MGLIFTNQTNSFLFSRHELYSMIVGDVRARYI